MAEQHTIRLVADLGEPATRTRAAAALAAHMGADALFLFVEDSGTGALASAPGVSQPDSDEPHWREFLRQCGTSAVHSGMLADRDGRIPAVGYRGSGVLLVFVGRGLQPQRADLVVPLLGLLGPMLRNERALAAARSEGAGWPNGAFLGRLAHEVRNYLTPVTMVTYVLQRKGESLRELGMIERQVAQLLRMVNDVLDMSRIARGAMVLEKERLELATVIARAVEIAGPLLAEKDQALAVEEPGDGLQVDGDPERLAQVFANLLSNAARHSDAKTRIAIIATRADERVAVRVKDQGCGIEPGMLDTIFEQLMRGRRGDQPTAGLGLGLTLVKNLVALHGGTVRAVSEGLGKGSEFIVELPLADTDGGRPGSH